MREKLIGTSTFQPRRRAFKQGMSEHLTVDIRRCNQENGSLGLVWEHDCK